MTSWNSASVDKFVKTVAQARAFNSKEVRLSIQDAESLCDSITHMLLQERELTQKLLIMHERAAQNAPSVPTNMSLNGGSF